MKPGYLVDAGVIIRMFRADHAQHSPQATALFKRAEAGEFRLEISDVTAAEVVGVLTSFYKVSRHDVANSLLRLLGNPGVVASDAPWLTRALESFRDLNVDATDCFLAAFATHQNKPLISFDRDYRKFPVCSGARPIKFNAPRSSPKSARGREHRTAPTIHDA